MDCGVDERAAAASSVTAVRLGTRRSDSRIACSYSAREPRRSA
jgi:hypothetical protein